VKEFVSLLVLVKVGVGDHLPWFKPPGEIHP